MTKRFKKFLILAVVFTITFVNYGMPLQAIASEGGLFFSAFNFFKKDEVELKAYFEGNEEQKENVLDVNNTTKLTVEVNPLIEGYLKSGSLKLDFKSGRENNFKIKGVLVESEGLENLETTAESENTEVIEQIEKPEQIEEPKQELVDLMQGVEVPMAGQAGSSSLGDLIQDVLVDEKIETEETDKTEGESLEDQIAGQIEDIRPTTPEVQTEESTMKLPDENKTTDESLVDVLIPGEVEIADVAKVIDEIVVVSENEIKLNNIIKDTKLQIELEYKQGEKISSEDLYNNIVISLVGNYINKNLETVEITYEDEVTLGWEYSKEIEVKSEFVKVSPFTVGENFGTIVENIVTVKRNIEDVNCLPIKETNIKIEIPKINDKLPIAVSVSANKLMATLGKELEGEEFSKDNWSYDQETGILEIIVINNTMLAGRGEDKFDIICRYEDYIEDASITLNKNITVKVEEYSSKENKIQEKSINEEEEKEVVAGELMSYSAVETNIKINKGKINANYYIDNGYQTRFSNIVNATILTGDILDEITIEPAKEIYKLEDGSELDATNDIMYSGVNFNYAEIKEMLDQGSTIDLLDENDNVFHTISKEAPAYLIEFAENINTVKVRINNVKVNGNLSIEFVKTIVKCQHTPAEFAKVMMLENTVKANVKYVGFEDTFQLPEIKVENEFENSITNVDFTMDKSELSAIAGSENVEFKIDLMNNLDTSDIYKNPTFEMVFPVYIKEVKVNNIYALYQNGLEISNYSVFEEDGLQKLRIELSGTQTGFDFTNATNGTNIILDTDLVIDEIAPQKEDEIKLYYYNEVGTDYQAETSWSISKGIPAEILKDKNGYDEIKFEYKSLTGLIVINSITNFDGTGRTIKSIEQGEVIEIIPVKGESHRAVMELSLLNNTGNTLTNAVLLGRIPFEGNKDVGTGNDLGTNIDTIMRTVLIPDELNSNSVTIYYSANPNADRDLNNETNGWNPELTQPEAIKSFMIVVDGNLENGGILKFKYDFEIPANLGYEVKMLGTFGAFYNDLEGVQEVIADKVGLLTEAGAKYEATMSVNIGEGAEIGEHRELVYTVKVKNTGSIDLKNIKIENKKPNYGVIKNAEEMENDIAIYNIEQLLVGEEKEKKIIVKTTNMPKDLENYISKIPNIEIEITEEGETKYYILTEDNQKSYITEMPSEFFIENFATVYVEDTIKGVETNTIKNKLVDTKFDIGIEEFNHVNVLNPGETFKYIIDVLNTSDETMSNVSVEYNMPKELKYLETESYIDNEIKIEFNDETNLSKVSIDKIEPGFRLRYAVCCEVATKNISEVEIENMVTVYADEDIEEKSESLTSLIQGPELTITQETNLENDTVLEMDKFQILVNINNKGEAESQRIDLEVELPEILQVLDVSSEGKRMINYTMNNNILTGNLYTLDAHDIATLVITAKSNPLGEGETNRILDINTKISENYIGELEINPLEITVLDNPDRDLTEEEKKEADDAVTVVDPTVTEDYKQDVEDAKKDEPTAPENTETTESETGTNTTVNEETERVEEKVEEVETYKIFGQVWKDENKDNTQGSDEDGMPKVAVTLYKGNTKIKKVVTDSLGKYRLTELEPGTYTLVFEYDGKTYIAAQYKAANVADDKSSDAIESDDGIAVTDNLNLVNSDIEVDLGLQSRDEFDMAVNKYISKAIVNTKGKETVKTYEDKQLAKLEIRSKELKNTTIQLEYKIAITNTGNVNGRVGIVKDYLPKTLTFDEANNSGWKLGSDGALYNETLKDTIIKAGETKELKLIVNKVMTEDNTGTISNKVEISEMSAEKPLNENTENNIATQEMIITISTGRTISIITMITLLILCSAVIYGIKTGKIKRIYK